MFDKYSNEFRDIDPRCLMTVLVALSLSARSIFFSLSFMLYIAARIFALLHISKSESAILSLIYLLHPYYSHSGITCREDRFVSFQQCTVVIISRSHFFPSLLVVDAAICVERIIRAIMFRVDFNYLCPLM